MQAFVCVKLRFEGHHCWPAAPDEVDFLRHRHRHEFHVEAEKLVHHDDRDTEFILLKRAMRAHIHRTYPQGELGTKSCEMLARELAEMFHLRRCVVLEDGENGGGVEL